ncbi:MAG: hypothetical protein JST26_02880 [Bacteroidetes bacterium]|nr:hypothetical protein [Bacteroidota bacterium]
MQKLPFKALGLAMIIGLTTTSCGHDPAESEEKEKTDSLVVAVDSSQVTEEDNSQDFTLPSPLQVATIFKKSGLKFVPGITNAPANAMKYNGSDFKRAVNLGIYSSDLAYTMLNKQFEESKNYLKACKDIGSQLGLNRAFETNNLAGRFDKNIGKEDSLLKIISDLQMQTDILLEENKQKHITAIAFAGAWIESIYIASKVYSTDKTKNISVSLMEQFTIADKITRALKACETKSPECKGLNADIQSIISLFKNCEAVKAVENSEDDADYSKVKISTGELDAITARVSEVRTKLIN